MAPYLLITKSRLVRCPHPRTTLSSPKCNVVLDRVQRCPRPRTTNNKRSYNGITPSRKSQTCDRYAPKSLKYKSNFPNSPPSRPTSPPANSITPQLARNQSKAKNRTTWQRPNVTSRRRLCRNSIFYDTASRYTACPRAAIYSLALVSQPVVTKHFTLLPHHYTPMPDRWGASLSR